MNKIIKNIALIAFAGALFTSCNEDDNTGASVIDYNTATVTLTSTSPTMFDESGIDGTDANTFQVVIQATLSEPQPIDAVIDLVQTGGNADSADFEGSTITIPAGSTSASGTVNILQTGDIEGDETLVIGGSSRANFAVATFSHSVTINNDYVNKSLDLEVSWEGEITVDVEDVSTTTVQLCAMDFDILIFDETNGVYLPEADLGLQTGSCPESTNYEFEDGTYVIVAYLWANPHESLGDSSEVPFTVSFEHEYFTSGSLAVPGLFTLADPAETEAPLAYLNVSNGGLTYEVVAY